MPVNSPPDKDNPFTGSIDVGHLAQPATIASVKAYVAAVNGIAHTRIGSVTLSIHDDGTIDDNAIVRPDRDSSLEHPMVVVIDSVRMRNVLIKSTN